MIDAYIKTARDPNCHEILDLSKIIHYDVKFMLNASAVCNEI